MDTIFLFGTICLCPYLVVVPSFLSGSLWYKQCIVAYCRTKTRLCCNFVESSWIYQIHSVSQFSCYCYRNISCVFVSRKRTKMYLFFTRHVNGLRCCHMVSVTFPCAVDWLWLKDKKDSSTFSSTVLLFLCCDCYRTILKMLYIYSSSLLKRN